MKKILYILFCTSSITYAQLVVLSQEQSRLPAIVESPIVNMAEEDLYFNATYVSPANATTIQSVLDSDGAVRLGAGDYSASGNITMTSNQRLYGYYEEDGTTIGGVITVAAGSSNVHIERIDSDAAIILESGSPITNCTFKSIYYTGFSGTNVQLEDNLFIDLARATTRFDCGTSGYLRNNTFIKCFAQSVDDHVIMIGNTTTPSYGNIELSRNILTTGGDATVYDTLENHTLLASDAEAWAQTGGAGSTAAFYFRNTGRLVMDNVNGYGSFGSPAFDIQADEFLLTRRYIGSAGTPIVRTGTDFLYISGNSFGQTIETDVWDFIVHANDSNIELNSVDVSATITGADATKLQGLIYPTEYTPWAKPTFETLPDPTGVDWATDRVGQTDQSATIQALIDANGIAELDEGIYYISQPLVITNEQGIIGKGTGKTAIVGITDDFPLVLAADDVSVSQMSSIVYTLAHLTLQGGSVGFHIDPIGKETNSLQITNSQWKYLVFRNQNYGIHLDQFYAVDNVLIDNISFVGCNIGFYQDPLTRTDEVGEYVQNMYVDKTMFYNCQFINNNIALDMNADGRANNINAWVNCNFDGNGLAMQTDFTNGIYVANSIFKNHTGTNMIAGNAPMSFYSCDFTNNSVTNVFNKSIVFAEGCNFNDSVNFFSGSSNQLYLSNSNVTTTIDINNITRGLLTNNSISGSSSLSKPMVEIISGTALTVLDGTVNVYPQYLVKQ